MFSIILDYTTDLSMSSGPYFRIVLLLVLVMIGCIWCQGQQNDEVDRMPYISATNSESGSELEPDPAAVFEGMRRICAKLAFAGQRRGKRRLSETNQLIIDLCKSINFESDAVNLEVF